MELNSTVAIKVNASRYVQLFETEAAHPSFLRQLLRAFVTDAMAALDADASRVDQPYELFKTPRAHLICVVMIAAYHPSHPQLSHLPLDLTVHHNTTKPTYNNNNNSNTRIYEARNVSI